MIITKSLIEISLQLITKEKHLSIKFLIKLIKFCQFLDLIVLVIYKGLPDKVFLIRLAIP